MNYRVYTKSPIGDRGYVTAHDRPETAHFVTHDGRGMRLASSAVQRVYFGAEFCDELLPSGDELQAACSWTRQANIDLTLVTPPVSQNKLKQLDALLAVYKDVNPEGEVVFNDWGALAKVKAFGLRPILGRQLVKSKKDPRLRAIWNDLPLALRRYYQKINLFTPQLQEFLLRLEIERVEIDIPPQGIDKQMLRDLPFQISINYPFTYITTTRRCPTKYAYSSSLSIEPCTRPCQDFAFSLKNKEIGSLFVLGNTYFVENADDVQTYLQTLGCRLVIHQAPYQEMRTHRR